MKTKRRYILTDGRAAGGEFDDAVVFCFEETMHEAVRSAKGFGEAVIFSFVEEPAEPASGVDYFRGDLRLERVVRS